VARSPGALTFRREFGTVPPLREDGSVDLEKTIALNKKICREIEKVGALITYDISLGKKIDMVNYDVDPKKILDDFNL
jgi:hypothetical protein